MAETGSHQPPGSFTQNYATLEILATPSGTLLPGPLHPLRLASLSPETPSKVHRKHTKTQKIRDSRGSHKIIRLKHPQKDPGFAFGVDFPLAPRPLSEASMTPPLAANNSGQMATVFLSAAKAAKEKYHVVDALHAKAPLLVLTLQDGVSVTLTPTAKRRAEFVKSSLSLKYTWLFRVAEPTVGDSGTHPGLDPGYNPLQVLRNRSLRKKTGVDFSESTTTPLPCDAFSAHAPVNGHPWKMLWGIDLHEFVADLAWRKTHWSQLRNAKGDLWYPEAYAAQNSAATNTKSRKLHDRLWREVDREPQTPEPTKPTKSNWKDRARRLYGALSLSAVDLRVLGNPLHTPLKSADILAPPKSTSVYLDRDARSQSADLAEYPYHTNQSQGSDGQNLNYAPLPPPQIIIGDHPLLRPDTYTGVSSGGEHTEISDHNHISDIGFRQVHLKQSLVSLRERTPFYLSSVSVEAGPLQAELAKQQKVLAATGQMHYLEVLATLDANFLSSVYPQLIDSTSVLLDVLVEGEVHHVLRSINHFNAVLLPARENLYRGFIEEAKSITHLANVTCAVKIDNLLSSTDRSYGELNTSLIMELRKSNEKLDRLNRSLFTGVIANPALIDDTASRYELSNHKFLYIALENVIVVFLRLVWIGVNLAKPVVVFLRLIWKLFTLMFT